LWQPQELNALVREAVADSASLSTEDAFMGDIALRLLQRERPTFFAATFRDVDAAQHLHWNEYEPRFYRRKRAPEGEPNFAIPDAYARFDRIAGQLIAAAGPEAIVIVVSDHGHGPWFTWLGRGTPGGHTNSPDGIFFAAGPGIRHGRVTSMNCLDVAPTVLHLLGLPAAQDLDGRVLTEIFEAGSAFESDLPRIASYEGEASPRESGAAGEAHSGEVLSSTVDAGILEKLETLGYIR
jgi:arylsulfatase A-like enzyme